MKRSMVRGKELLLTMAGAVLVIACAVAVMLVGGKAVSKYLGGVETLQPFAVEFAWAAEPSAIFAGGSGTAEDPYTIETLSQLEAFRNDVNSGNTYAGKTIKLTGDIDLAGIQWTPIGEGTRVHNSYDKTNSHPFEGTFDGSGHTISSLTITEPAPSADYALGLFGIASAATIKNVTLDNVMIKTDNSELTGGIVGLMVDDSKVEGSKVSGSIQAVSGAGGICGRMIIAGTIANCANTADVTVTGGTGNVGGIVGAAYYTEPTLRMNINACSNSGKISGTFSVGGISGLNAAFVSGCTNTGSVTGSDDSVGGIVGEALNYGAIVDCTNFADVTNTSQVGYGTGGIVGWVRYTGGVTEYRVSAPIAVENNTNKGAVRGGNDAGGIVGSLFNAGTVTGNTNEASEISAKVFAAGIVGNLQKIGTVPSSVEMKAVVENNVTKTPQDRILATNTNEFAYNNDPGGSTFTVVDNGYRWDGGRATTEPQTTLPDNTSNSSDATNNGTKATPSPTASPSPTKKPTGGVPQTGDSLPILWVLGALLIAAAGAGTVVAMSAKRATKKGE